MSAKRLSSSGLDAEMWIPQQKKAFSSWVNSILAGAGVQLDGEKDLASAFDDGLMLIPLAELLVSAEKGEEVKARKHVAKPKMRIHKSENVALAFEVLESAGFHPDAHVEELLDSSEKMTLGLIWQLFLRFGFAGDQSKADLLAWVKERVNDNERYPGVNVTDIPQSFKDGKAFAALLDSLSPSILDYTSLDTSADEADGEPVKAVARLNAAFDAANEKLDVPKLLDASDVAAFGVEEKAGMMLLSLIKAAWDEKEEELLAAERAEAERRANMTKEDALAELDAALAKLAKLKNCPECGFDLQAWLESQEA